MIHSQIIAKIENDYMEVDLPVVERGADYSDTSDKEDNEKSSSKTCKTIDGPGQGLPCVFPFTLNDQEYNACTKDGDKSVKQYWCSTSVDEDGVHVSGHWGACSKGCPGVKHEGYNKEKCDTVEHGSKCVFPFSYKGYTYFGCIRGYGEEQYWCAVKKKKQTFKRVLCSETCPHDNMLSMVKLSSKEIVAKLKIIPHVFSMVEKDGNCDKELGDHNMTQVHMHGSIWFIYII